MAKPSELVYGVSLLQRVRPIWKQVRLIEQALGRYKAEEMQREAHEFMEKERQRGQGGQQER